MPADKNIQDFLQQYSESVYVNALALRKMLRSCLPDITEQLDLPARPGMHNYPF